MVRRASPLLVPHNVATPRRRAGCSSRPVASTRPVCASSRLSDSRGACDVLVLGFGVHAASVARDLSEAGRRVVLAWPLDSAQTQRRPSRAPVFAADAHGTGVLTCLHAAAPAALQALGDAAGAHVWLDSGGLHLAPQTWLSSSLDAACSDAGVAMLRLSAADLSARFPCFAKGALPPDWEARLAVHAGTVHTDTLGAVLRASCDRQRVTWLGGVDLVDCEDKGGSFRLLIRRQGDDTGSWLESEHLVLAPDSALEARTCLSKLQMRVEVADAPTSWCVQRPAKLRDAYALMPAWQTHAALAVPAVDENAPPVELPPLQGCSMGSAEASVLLQTHGLPADADARALRAAGLLLPALHVSKSPPPTWHSTHLVGCPDRGPVCSAIPGLEAGRVALVAGEAQHALSLSPMVRDILGCVAPTDARLMQALSMQRAAFAEAAQMQAESRAAEAAAWSAGEEERKAAPALTPANDDTLSLIQGRAKRNVGGPDDVVFMPRPRMTQ